MNKQINKPFTKTCLFISYYLFKQLYLFIYTNIFMNLYLSFEFICVFKFMLKKYIATIDPFVWHLWASIEK